jgi:hypothetical protein
LQACECGKNSPRDGWRVHRRAQTHNRGSDGSAATQSVEGMERPYQSGRWPLAMQKILTYAKVSGEASTLASNSLAHTRISAVSSSVNLSPCARTLWTLSLRVMRSRTSLRIAYMRPLPIVLKTSCIRPRHLHSPRLPRVHHQVGKRPFQGGVSISSANPFGIFIAIGSSISIGS